METLGFSASLLVLGILNSLPSENSSFELLRQVEPWFIDLALEDVLLALRVCDLVSSSSLGV